LLSLIDSKFLQLDRGGIGLGSFFAKHERDILNIIKLMRLRKILNLEKLMDVKLNETKNQVPSVHTSPTMHQRLKT
jgi:hypothetical protein